MIKQIFQNLNFKSETQLFVSKLLIQIFFPPLMIFFWGKEKFDLWLFLFSIPAFISVFQFSIISPVRNHMLSLFKKKKFHEINLYYQNSFFFYY